MVQMTSSLAPFLCYATSHAYGTLRTLETKSMARLLFQTAEFTSKADILSQSSIGPTTQRALHEVFRESAKIDNDIESTEEKAHVVAPFEDAPFTRCRRIDRSPC